MRHYLAPDRVPICHTVKQRQQSTSSKSWCLKNELVEIGRLRKPRREIILSGFGMFRILYVVYKYE